LQKPPREVASKKRADDEATLQSRPDRSLPFATLDLQRSLRQGFPEVVFCEGKTDAQVLAIFGKLAQVESVVLGTRVNRKLATQIKKRFPKSVYHATGRTVVLHQSPPVPRSGRITVMTAGTADLPVAEEAKTTSEALGYAVTPVYDVGVAGLHRLFDRMEEVQAADVVIVVAGMDGVLPSIVGGLIGQPVIAVPSSIGYGTGAGGIAALMTMLNSCAAGVAVMNIDNGFGAALLAHRILWARVAPSSGKAR
jgi:NCAIR mutase (PurE)-related protein